MQASINIMIGNRYVIHDNIKQNNAKHVSYSYEYNGVRVICLDMMIII